MSAPVQSIPDANTHQMPEESSISANSMPSANVQSNINSQGRVVKQSKNIRRLLLEAQLERIKLMQALLSLNI